MDELTVSGKRYISSRRAAKEYHYHSDYIGQLIRSAKVSGQKVGRTWYVGVASLESYLRQEASKEESQGTERRTKRRTTPESKSESSVLNKKETSNPLSSLSSEVAEEEKVLQTDKNSTTRKVQPKMLRYFPDESKDSETTLLKENKSQVRKEEDLEEEDYEYDSHQLRSDKEAQPMLNSEEESEYEQEEEEMPVPLHVLSDKRAPLSAPAIPESSQLYYPYLTSEIATPVLESSRSLTKIIFILLILGLVVFIGSLYVSLNVPLSIGQVSNF